MAMLKPVDGWTWQESMLHLHRNGVHVASLFPVPSPKDGRPWMVDVNGLDELVRVTVGTLADALLLVETLCPERT